MKDGLFTEDDLFNMSSLEITEALYMQSNPDIRLYNGFENGPCDLLSRSFDGDESNAMSWTTDWDKKTMIEGISDSVNDYYADKRDFNFGYVNNSKFDDELLDGIPDGPHGSVVRNAAELYSGFKQMQDDESAEAFEDFFKDCWGLDDDVTLADVSVFTTGDPYRRHLVSARQHSHFILGHDNMQSLITPHLGPYVSAASSGEYAVNWNRVANILRFIGMLTVIYEPKASIIARKQRVTLYYRISKSCWNEIKPSAYVFKRVKARGNKVPDVNGLAIKRYLQVSTDDYDRVHHKLESGEFRHKFFDFSIENANDWSFQLALKLLRERRSVAKLLIPKHQLEKTIDQIIPYREEKHKIEDMFKKFEGRKSVHDILVSALFLTYVQRWNRIVPEEVNVVTRDKTHYSFGEVSIPTKNFIENNKEVFWPAHVKPVFKQLLIFKFKGNSIKVVSKYFMDITQNVHAASNHCSTYGLIHKFFWNDVDIFKETCYAIRLGCGKAINYLSNERSDFLYADYKPTDFHDIVGLCRKLAVKKLEYWRARYKGRCEYAKKVLDSEKDLHPDDTSEGYTKLLWEVITNGNRVKLLKDVQFDIDESHKFVAFINSSKLRDNFNSILDNYSKHRKIEHQQIGLDFINELSRVDRVIRPRIPFMRTYQDIRRIITEVTQDIMKQVEKHVYECKMITDADIYTDYTEDENDENDVRQAIDKWKTERKLIGKRYLESSAAVKDKGKTKEDDDSDDGGSLLDFFDDDDSDIAESVSSDRNYGDYICLIEEYGSSFVKLEDAEAFLKQHYGSDIDLMRVACADLSDNGVIDPNIIRQWIKEKSQARRKERELESEHDQIL